MVRIPLHSYGDDFNQTYSSITIKDCYWTGKTFRFTCHTEADGKEFFCYAVHPELPKVNSDDWIAPNTTPFLWGSEVDGEVLKERIFYNEYYISHYSNGKWYLDVCGTVDKLRKKELVINGDESDIAHAYYGTDNLQTVGVSKRIADKVDAFATGTRLLNQQEYELLKGKEQKKMNSLFDGIKVGKASQEYSITYFGTVAFRGKTYYNGKIFDATGMTINFDMLYLVPASEVKEGDIVEKNNRAYYVKGVNNGVVNSIDLMAGTEENLVPGGPFGMTLYSKIFNPFGSMKGENAFGNMLMLQALSDRDGGNNGMLMAMMMMQGGFKLPTFEMPNLDLSNKETK